MDHFEPHSIGFSWYKFVWSCKLWELTQHSHTSHFITMAQMAKYGTEGQAKNIIACTIFVCRPTKKLMVPMERLSLKDLF